MKSKYIPAPKGAVFGKWLVVDYSHFDNEHYWTVLCQGCSTTHSRRASQLALGRSSGCQHCNAIEREKYSFWEGIDGISKQYLTKLSYRGKEISVTLQDLADQWKAQEGKCAYTGLQLTLVQKDTMWKDATASLDRIDSSKGYIKGNIQWVHKRVNIMKNDMNEKEFLEFCKLVVKRKGGTCGV